MRRNSLTTLIILIVFIPVAVRFFWLLPIIAIILFVSVFRFVRSIMNQDRKGEDAGRKAEPDYTETHYQKTEDDIITCDYCGSRFDTSKHATCPHCGGPYWDDAEWKDIRNRKVG